MISKQILDPTQRHLKFRVYKTLRKQRDLTQALTVTGICETLQDTAEIARVKAAFVRQHPQLTGFIRKDEMVVMCVQVEFFLLLKGPERTYFEILDKQQPIK